MAAAFAPLHRAIHDMSNSEFEKGIFIPCNVLRSDVEEIKDLCILCTFLFGHSADAEPIER
eukprot:CAMPEP_0114522856 /NCGR_PEP_ID=MMETSP0109-20121206/20970_1 /TAXON_ID=29199 /ORGANISM="Chlorarachnion reptans, Strain CCCM449" /LENGTH=60 /DNA_ID=CAMNT_0001704111 /DNA_START=557 /DNA_END=739 /DNA_ORIENTATION=+